ncbi:MAG: type II secretion system minor pseudopilin GspK [Alphaproteobacteria bacterium]|uniref:type II secretion system minor pseudopilin GspK n=1 Tax=Hyphomonas sp. TaxID=87 RepID=UPI001DC031EE|nr:type II secretion system minor pseudopilin GspK [Alphaproteobacteria bacterium]MBU2085249.1 type II secretion system minor pseudopilin GspK [Alphaproteobacteria bacterium]MBU2142179.1 type II secretion system minor pseudopilin GspK [Alphaproteobacteria bacterium]MBU2197396.1 type II secretion system minor pseudopilin GspK [Alphaproteobacteria bacterium]
MTQATSPKDRGAALLSILMIVAVMSVAALAAVEALGRSLSLARVSSERSQAMWAARSTEALGILAVARLKVLGDDAMREALVSGQSMTLPFERGVIQATFTDASNCFNLNTITGEANDVNHINFQHLLEAMDIFRADAQALAESLADWTDSDSAPRAYGAEAGYYGTLETPYRPGNAPLTNISELRAIKGFTPEIIALIEPLVCVRPDRFQSALNIETLTEEEAPLLVALYSGELSREDAQSVIQAKPLAGWQSLDTFLQNGHIQTIAVAARNDSMLSLKPSNLRLTARIVSGSTQENLQLVYAMDKGGQASLIQRTTGDF